VSPTRYKVRYRARKRHCRAAQNCDPANSFSHDPQPSQIFGKEWAEKNAKLQEEHKAVSDAKFSTSG